MTITNADTFLKTTPSTEARVKVGVATASGVIYIDSNAALRLFLPHGAPASVPESQLYYWTREWQEQEAESRKELANGESREFTNATDAIQWLFDSGDD